MSSSGIDLGLLFFVLAGLSAAPLLKPAPGLIAQPSPDGGPVGPEIRDQVLVKAIEASRKSKPVPLDLR